MLLLIAVVGASLFVLFFKTRYLNMMKPCILFIMLIPHTYMLLSMVRQSTTAGSALAALLINLLPYGCRMVYISSHVGQNTGGLCFNDSFIL